MFAKQKLAAAAIACAMLLAACAAASTRQTTAEALAAILAGHQRSPENRARDVYRHPKETLLFFGIRPEMRVLEVWPEPGWYTESSRRSCGTRASTTRRSSPPTRQTSTSRSASETTGTKLARTPRPLRPRGRGHASPPTAGDVVPPGSVDMVVTFRNIHNWMARRHGAAGVCHHVQGAQARRRARRRRAPRQPGVPQDPKAKSGYVNEDYAIRLIEAQGFRLVAQVARSTPTRRTRRTTSRVCGRCRRRIGWGQGPRQVRRDRRERPLYAEVREAGEVARGAALTTSLSARALTSSVEVRAVAPQGVVPGERSRPGRSPDRASSTPSRS